MTKISVKDFEIGSDRLTIIAGPCMAESLELCQRVAESMAHACAQYGFNYIFKASYDKANRTSVSTQRGPGIDEGLKILARIGEQFQLPLTTDIHSPEQANQAASVVDVLQIPAFLCRQSDLLEAAATTGKAVNVKKGQFLAPWDAKNIVEKLRSFSANGIMLTERGTTFGYNALVVDMSGLEIMQGFDVPVCFDATHSVQRPGGAGTSSGGIRESIPALARAATAVGVNALFLEVHPDPANALSDAATQWPLDRIHELLLPIARIHQALSTV